MSRAPVNPLMAATIESPISSARRWRNDVVPATNLPLIDLSQAAPTAPPPDKLRDHIAELVRSDDAVHLYGPDLGHPPLRAEIARVWSRIYGGEIAADQVAVTAGCNQAFTAAMSTLAGPGDEVILPSPWYFNHFMHCTMSGVVPVVLDCGPGLLPDPDRAEALITASTRAIVLVTPNNPTGLEYPADLLSAFLTVAQRHGLALVIDETYRDFRDGPPQPHALFQDANWADTLIHLYSFSKAYHLTGHRVGAIVAGADRLFEVEKYVDTTTICANQLAQRAALWGLQNLHDWIGAENARVQTLRQAFIDGLADLKGWHMRGSGAYFAYLEHPFDMDAVVVAKMMLRDANVLALPGTMFRAPSDPQGERELRLAFANIDRAGIDDFLMRLQNLAG